MDPLKGNKTMKPSKTHIGSLLLKHEDDMTALLDLNLHHIESNEQYLV